MSHINSVRFGKFARVFFALALLAGTGCASEIEANALSEKYEDAIAVGHEEEGSLDATLFDLDDNSTLATLAWNHSNDSAQITIEDQGQEKFVRVHDLSLENANSLLYSIWKASRSESMEIISVEDLPGIERGWDSGSTYDTSIAEDHPQTSNVIVGSVGQSVVLTSSVQYTTSFGTKFVRGGIKIEGYGTPGPKASGSTNLIKSISAGWQELVSSSPTCTINSSSTVCQQYTPWTSYPSSWIQTYVSHATISITWSNSSTEQLSATAIKSY